MKVAPVQITGFIVKMSLASETLQHYAEKHYKSIHEEICICL